MADAPIWNQDDLWQNLYERFFDVAATIGDCVAVALRDTPGTSGEPTRKCYPNFGGLAWDDCDCGGVLQVSMGRRTATLNFPQDQNEGGGGRPTSCAAGLPMQDFTLEYIRCWPSPSQRGNPPTCQQMATVTRQLNADIFAIRKAMYECLCNMKTVERRISDFVVRASQPAGPEGSCTGWSTAFSVEVPSLG